MSVACKWSDGRQLYVGPLPGRKRIALYTIRGSALEVIAWFPTEDAASRFCNIVWNVTYPDAETYAAPV